MKKFMVLLMAAMLMVSAAACSSGQQETGNSDSGNAQAGKTAASDGSNVLVAYFSWADNALIEGEVDAVTSPSVVAPGHVAQLASWVQEETGGELFSIQVTEPYSSDWDECLERGNEERSQNARPELKESVENIENYDVVFLGYPKMEQGYICVQRCIAWRKEGEQVQETQQKEKVCIE